MKIYWMRVYYGRDLQIGRLWIRINSPRMWRKIGWGFVKWVRG